MRFVLRWAVNVLALLFVTKVVAGVTVETTFALVIAALVLGIFNAIVRPVLLIITLPISILTLGIFTLFINAFMFYLTALVVPGFSVEGFWDTFWGSLLFSIVNFIITLIVAQPGQGPVFVARQGRPPDHRNPRYPGAIDVEARPTPPESEPKKDERKHLP